MPEQYRVENWSEYNQALRKRVGLTIWMESAHETEQTGR